MRLRRTLWTAACAAWIEACGGSSSSLPGGSGQPTTDVAEALCQKLDSCSHFYLQAAYGDVPTCAARLQISIANALAAPGTGRTAANLETCARALPGASCADLVDNDSPAACRAVPGTLGTGMACSDASQCSTAFCNIAAGETCGACAAPPPAGTTCNGNSQCAPGSVCAGSPSVCLTPGAAGAACSATQPCQGTLICNSNVCATPVAVGAACAVGKGTCNLLEGDYCPATTQQCTAATIASAGAACGLTNGALAACSASGMCTAGGTCLAAAADGQNCNAANGPPCIPPAVCQNGVCTLPSSANCK